MSKKFKNPPTENKSMISVTNKLASLLILNESVIKIMQINFDKIFDKKHSHVIFEYTKHIKLEQILGTCKNNKYIQLYCILKIFKIKQSTTYSIKKTLKTILI